MPPPPPPYPSRAVGIANITRARRPGQKRSDGDAAAWNLCLRLALFSIFRQLSVYQARRQRDESHRCPCCLAALVCHLQPAFDMRRKSAASGVWWTGLGCAVARRHVRSHSHFETGGLKPAPPPPPPLPCPDVFRPSVAGVLHVWHHSMRVLFGMSVKHGFAFQLDPPQAAVSLLRSQLEFILHQEPEHRQLVRLCMVHYSSPISTRREPCVAVLFAASKEPFCWAVVGKFRRS